MPYVRPSDVGDAEKLAPYLRQADLEELAAATHNSPKESLSLGYFLGKPCRSFVNDDDSIIGMFGVTPMKTEDGLKWGAIWCLTSDELFRRRKYFMRNCRDEIKKISKGYDKVINFVHHKNTRHIRWIKAMGFNMADKPTPFGYKEELFYYFEKVITDV